ncbi:acyltransferase family protein [Sphingomonas sp. CV7422]|uniref:acyltransferase family protein n=1 Tax=Sphingomonas sp. CV7422 TaxID=3018036 RepID=UPI0022FDE2D0|nr:acyltransferase family protein [Sphingomonas sp. CV7422]
MPVALRLIAFIAVVLIHAVADSATDAATAADAIAVLARFAVPFLFVAFGYFLSSRAPARTALRLLVRLAPPFFVWALVYILYFKGSLAELRSPAMLVRLLVTGLDGQHLWFLPALGIAGVLFALVKSRLGWGAVLALTLLFYALALAFGPYRGLFDLSRPPFNTRNGTFFGLLFVAGGAWIREDDIRPRTAPALALFALATILQLGEVAALHAQGTIPFPRFTDDTLMTIPYGIAAFLVALALPPTLRLPPLLAQLARLSHGLYVVHLLFLDLAVRLIGRETLAACLVDALLAVIASALCVLALDRLPFTQRLIR